MKGNIYEVQRIPDCFQNHHYYRRSSDYIHGGDIRQAMTKEDIVHCHKLTMNNVLDNGHVLTQCISQTLAILQQTTYSLTVIT